MIHQPARVLHVTEAMGGGIVTFIDSISRRQAEAGASVSVLYSVRGDTPAADQLRERFDDRVTLLDPIVGSKANKAFNMARAIRKHVRSNEYDVVHLHSSIAGGLGRIAAVGRSPARVVYSPHGFAFLREDSSCLTRRATQLAERVLARRSKLLVTSNSELEITRTTLKARDAVFLRSGVPRATVPTLPTSASHDRLRVTMLGRMVYQKAPWRFAHVARELHELADFVWVGGGDQQSREKWIGDAPVEIIEWATMDEVEEILAETDVFLFPTLWEGMSLSLIQAQGRGLPAVTSDVVGNRDAVLNQQTGFVCTDDAHLVEATRTLLLDEELRLQMGVAAQDWARTGLVDDEIGIDSLHEYFAPSSR